MKTEFWCRPYFKLLHEKLLLTGLWWWSNFIMLAFYSGNPSLNAAEVCSFYSVRISNCLKRTKMVEKETGNLRLKITFDILFHLGWAECHTSYFANCFVCDCQSWKLKAISFSYNLDFSFPANSIWSTYQNRRPEAFTRNAAKVSVCLRKPGLEPRHQDRAGSSRQVRASRNHKRQNLDHFTDPATATRSADFGLNCRPQRNELS